LTEFHKILYERYATGGHPNLVQIPRPVTTRRTDGRTDGRTNL